VTSDGTVEDVGDPVSADRDLTRQRAARWWRRGALALLAVLVLAGLLGVLGVRKATVTAESAGYRLRVVYPAITRPGLAVVWQIDLERAGGFEGDVELAVDGRYFELFDENSLDPEPSESRSAGETELWTFTQPEGDRLVIDFDARVSPTWQLQAQGSVAVREGSVDVVQVRFTTWNLP
jgi:hypothetical protein